MAKKTESSKLAKLDETGRRKKSDRRKGNAPVSNERRKTARRRQIDPTTCEREYSDAEIENAVADARRAGIDGVVSVGGGSSMDTAKLVAVLVQSDQPLQEMYGVGLNFSRRSN